MCTLEMKRLGSPQKQKDSKLKGKPYRHTTSIYHFQYQKWTVKGNPDSTTCNGLKGVFYKRPCCGRADRVHDSCDY